MTKPHNLDLFCSGHLIVDKHKKITFCNSYISNLCGSTPEQIIGQSIDTYFTKASTIFINSHIYPLLLKNLSVHETQVTWLGKNAERTPVVVSIKLAQDDTSYWGSRD
ncbi:MAG TPA: GGDEF domain-containing protein, partial [Glaciecola sp.]|nr:GGDEF domain-containing protein [Glaciecola sp.]